MKLGLFDLFDAATGRGLDAAADLPKDNDARYQRISGKVSWQAWVAGRDTQREVKIHDWRVFFSRH